MKLFLEENQINILLKEKINNFISKNEIDTLAAEALGSYVYMLVDKYDKPFYIGKGTGRRVLQHFEDSIKQISKDSTKISHIKRIFETEEPKIKLLRYSLSTDNNDREAFLVEQVAIDLLGINNLVNEVAGHGTQELGTRYLDDFLNEHRSIPLNAIDLPETVLGVKINKYWDDRAWRNARTAETLYDASRRAWRLDKNKILEKDGSPKIKYVLPIAGGIIRAVYVVTSWHRDELLPQKWRFEGHPVNEPNLIKLIGKNSKDTIVFGQQSSIAYGKRPIQT
jgi:hypothetical protein